jgi:hypothetical protein
MMKLVRVAILPLLVTVLLLAGCEDLTVEAPQLPDLPELPTVSVELPELPSLEEMARDLNLPDLSQISDLPQLVDLPIQQTPAGAINFNGPTERQISVGDWIPGTNMVLAAMIPEGAEFEIGSLRAIRRIGDSLDFDGPWPGVENATYSLRLRVYFVGDEGVRAAGVHQLIVYNVEPQVDPTVVLGDGTVRFPFTVGVAAGETLTGTTIRYLGSDESGGQLGGLAEGEYPYRRVGDSIVWRGRVRSDIVAEFQLRMLFYTAEQAQVGGLVTLDLSNLSAQ